MDVIFFKFGINLELYLQNGNFFLENSGEKVRARLAETSPAQQPARCRAHCRRVVTLMSAVGGAAVPATPTASEGERRCARELVGCRSTWASRGWWRRCSLAAGASPTTSKRGGGQRGRRRIIWRPWRVLAGGARRGGGGDDGEGRHVRRSDHGDA